MNQNITSIDTEQDCHDELLCSDCARKDRRRNSQAAIYECANRIAVAHIARISPEKEVGTKGFDELWSAVLFEAWYAALSLWDEVDNQIQASGMERRR